MGSSQTGSNYQQKPYIDDSSSLPTVGNRVNSLFDYFYVEGVVDSVSGAGVTPRTVTISSGFMAAPPNQGGNSWSFTPISSGTPRTYNWQYLTYGAASGSSVAFLARAFT
jgi:hypothetical protein